MRLGAALWRSFLVQASFNYDRMIGVGLAFTMRPLVDDDPQRAARACQFFNAHPYFSPLAAGALARAEGDRATESELTGLRNALVSTLGSVGDRMIWAGTLPAAAGLGLVLIVTVHPVVGLAGFLVLYNVVHVMVRWWGLRSGWASGVQVARALGATRIQRSLRVVGPLAGASVGLALPIVAEWLLRDFARAEAIGAAVVALCALVLGRWMAPSIGGLRFGLIAAGFILILSAVWP